MILKLDYLERWYKIMIVVAGPENTEIVFRNQPRNRSIKKSTHHNIVYTCKAIERLITGFFNFFQHSMKSCGENLEEQHNERQGDDAT